MFLEGFSWRAFEIVSLRIVSMHLLKPRSVNASKPKSCLEARLMINGLGQMKLNSCFLSILKFARNHLETALVTFGSSVLVIVDKIYDGDEVM